MFEKKNFLRLVSGDLDKFRIDADTGEIFTTQGYKHFKLIIY